MKVIPFDHARRHRAKPYFTAKASDSSNTRSSQPCQIIAFPKSLERASHQDLRAGACVDHQELFSISKKTLDFIATEINSACVNESEKCEKMIHVLEGLAYVAKDLRKATSK